MTVQSPSPPAQEPAAWTYDDEIDLRQYLDILIKWWREIVVIAVLAAVLAGAAALLLDQVGPPAYEASASAVIARVSSEVTLDERFQTTSDGAGGTEVARRSALVNLVNSAAVADAVITDLGDLLTPEQQNPARLLGQVEAELAPSSDNRTPSDVIRITATAATPEKAAAIANAWVRNYVDQVNAIYGQVPEGLLASVQTELTVAEGEFEEAQRQLESFIAANDIQPLTRRLEAEQALLAALRQSRIDAELAVVSQDLQLRQALFADLSQAEIQPVLALLQEQRQQSSAAISAAFGRQRQVGQLLEQARALAVQIQAGGDDAVDSNALALQLLKTEVFVPSSASSLRVEAAVPEGGDTTMTTVMFPDALQLNVETTSSAGSAEAQLADVQGLITALEEYQTQLDARIQELAAQVVADDAYQFLAQLDAEAFTVSAAATAGDEAPQAGTLPAAILQSYANLFSTGALSELVRTIDGEGDEILARIEDLERSVAQLTAALEAERARERQLTQKRDLAWNAYDTLSNKIVELNLERTASNSEVRLGAPATPPAEPVEGLSAIMAAAVGGALGLLFGVFYAFLANYMGKEPFLRRRTADAAA